MRYNSTKQSVIVYDGECAFCLQAINAIRARDRENQFVYLARQTPAIEEQHPDLKLGDFNTGMRLFEPDGKMHVGADAIYRITLRLPYFRWFSWLYRVPLLKSVIRGVYSWIAANRLRLSCYCSADCKLDTSCATAAGAASSYHMSGRQVLISVLILLILGLHGGANIAKAFVRSSFMGDRSWPFLAYGMYRQSYSPGVIQTTKQQIFALTATGEELPVVPQIVGLHGQALGRHYIGRMRRGDPTAARLLAERINLGRSDPVVAFRIDGESFAISSSGVVSEGKQSEFYPTVK